MALSQAGKIARCAVVNVAALRRWCMCISKQGVAGGSPMSPLSRRFAGVRCLAVNVPYGFTRSERRCRSRHGIPTGGLDQSSQLAFQKRPLNLTDRKSLAVKRLDEVAQFREPPGSRQIESSLQSGLHGADTRKASKLNTDERRGVPASECGRAGGGAAPRNKPRSAPLKPAGAYLRAP
jgi:hypothetical protein